MVPFGRCAAFPLCRGLTVVLGRGLILPLGHFRSPSVGRSRLLSPASGLGVEVTGQDDRVQGQPAGECRDPSNGDDDILAPAEHQAAVDDDPEEFLVGPHGNLLNQDQDGQPANRSELDTDGDAKRSRSWPVALTRHSADRTRASSSYLDHASRKVMWPSTAELPTE